jgi:DNA polymerase-3 subunit delta
MVAVKTQQADAFVSSPPNDITAVLIFGSDPGLVSERGQKLARSLIDRETPPGEAMRLDDSDLDDDAGRLATELQTRPMFSGRRIIRATAGRRIAAPLLKSVLADAPFEGVLIVEAGNLKSDDALRNLFEKNGAAVAIACYPDSEIDLERLVADVLAQSGMTIAPDARAHLVGRLGADRALSRAEIEKLALYAHGRTTVSLEDIDAVVGDASDLALEAIADAAAQGRGRDAVADFGRALAAGESAQTIIGILQRYFLKLHRVRSEVDAGASIDEALRALRPPLHFRQRDAFAAQIRRWSRDALDQALSRLGETARAARLNSGLEDVLAERLLLALSAMAGARGEGASRRR